MDRSPQTARSTDARADSGPHNGVTEAGYSGGWHETVL